MFGSDETPDGAPTDLTTALRWELLRLAALEETYAATEAALVPYWVPCPASVYGHRAAADALRENADRLLSPAA